MSEEKQFRNIARKVLFKSPVEENSATIPGEGKSAASQPDRHVRVKVTMNLDGDIIAYFKDRSAAEGVGYQWLLNQALREHIEGSRVEKLASEVKRLLLDDEVFLARLRRDAEV